MTKGELKSLLDRNPAPDTAEISIKYVVMESDEFTLQETQHEIDYLQNISGGRVTIATKPTKE